MNNLTDERLRGKYGLAGGLVARHEARPLRWSQLHEALLHWYVTTWATTWQRAADRSARTRRQDAGIVSVETVGWIGIAIAVVTVVGLIVKGKLTAMANSLPDSFGW